MSAALPKPETTLALIFGASKWPDCKRFEPLPSVEASSDAIYDLLRRSDGLGLPPRNVKNLFGSFEDAAEQLSQASSFIEFRRQEMSERGSRLTDLVIYYAGHGDFEGEAHDFYLTIRRTHSNHPMLTSITARELGNWVRRNAFDLRTYLMIDCCFAAAVQYGFMTSPLSLAELKLHEALPVQGPQVPLDEVASAGVALLAASGLNTPAIASPGETFTRFTAALLGILEAGHPHLPEFLSLSNVHSLLSAKLTTSYPNGTRPELRSLQQTHGRVELVGLFPNVARMRERAERERIERDARAAAARAERERSHEEKERVEREANEEAERLRQQDEHDRLERNTLEAAKRAECQRVEQERLDHERRGLLELLRQRYRQLEEANRTREEASEFNIDLESDILNSAFDAVHRALPDVRLPKEGVAKESMFLPLMIALVVFTVLLLLALVANRNETTASDSSNTSRAQSPYELVQSMFGFIKDKDEITWRPGTCSNSVEYVMQMRNNRIFWWKMPALQAEETVTSVDGNHFTTLDTKSVETDYDLDTSHLNKPSALRRTVHGSATISLIRCS